VVCNVCSVHICTWRKNSIWLITEVLAIANFVPFLHNMKISNLLYEGYPESKDTKAIKRFKNIY
jgi:hypothetical protein